MDINEIRKTLNVFKTDNGLLEVRIFSTINKTEIYSGIFDNEEDLIREVNKFDREPYNIYFVFNELKDALNGMPQLNKMIRGAKTVNNKDIKYRRWLMLDFDPIREGDVKDIASTQEEFENSKQTAREARSFLKGLGFEQPVVCFSGNGTHLLYRLDNIECTDSTDKVIQNVLKYLAMKFTDDKVDFDTKVSNTARLTKFYSSISRKGGNTKDRPHRKSEIVVIPPNIKPTPFTLLEHISAIYEYSQVGETPTNANYSNNNDNKKFDLDSFLVEHNIEVLKEIRNGDGGRKIILKECPFDSSHGKDSAIFVSAQGAITFTCFHSSCSGNNWRTLRLKFDPHAYDKPQYEQKQFKQPYVPYHEQQKKKKYQIQDELPELGEKWLSMSNIKKVDLTQLEKVKTGFHELDRNIIGLYMSEVTILSGSNSSGKSSWLNSLLLNIVQQGVKIALWSGELRPDILKTWIQMVAAGKDNLKPSQYGDGKYYVPNNIAERIDAWLDGKFFLYNNEYGTRWNQIFHDMEELLKVGVKVFVLDNLFSLDIDLFDGDKNNKQRELIIQIKDFCKKNQVHILLVAHPRKSLTFLRKNDISGSSDITNAVDNVFIIHRVNNDFTKAITEFYDSATANRYLSYGNVLSIEKNRMYGVVDVMCGFQYEIESRRFKNDINEKIVYDWENDKGEQQTLDVGYSEPTEPNYGFLEQGNGDVPF